MNTTEALIIIVLGASLVYGLYKGIIGQLTSLAGLIAGLLVTRVIASPVASVLASSFPSVFTTHTMALVISAVVIFILVYFAVGAVARLSRRLSKLLMVEWLDKLLGAVYSMFKWTLILSIVLNAWYLIAPYSGAFTAPKFIGSTIFHFIMHLAPDLFGIAVDKIGDLIPKMM